MSRVLVTGIEGFVGPHLARRLAAEGHTVLGLHRAEPKESLPAELYPGDICDFEHTRSLLDRTRPDSIIHLAGLSSVAASETYTLATYEVNALGTLKLLEAVRQLELRCRVVLISSADVYGRSNVGRPLTEDDPPLPMSPYALSKLMTGEAGRFFHRTYGMDVVILRPFSHTGPGQSPDFVFAKVASGIADIERGRREPVIEMGNLDVRRDYTDVRDVVRAYSLALAHCVAGETYNVTSGRPVVLSHGVNTLVKMARVPVTIRVSPARFRPHDIPVLTGDPARFYQATGWQPEIPFEQTLRDLLEYYRSR
ncbi:MAG: GDP-mannose 4,6-dehydratase [candidate division WOR-3 bacterium]